MSWLNQGVYSLAENIQTIHSLIIAFTGTTTAIIIIIIMLQWESVRSLSWCLVRYMLQLTPCVHRVIGDSHLYDNNSDHSETIIETKLFIMMECATATKDIIYTCRRQKNCQNSM